MISGFIPETLGGKLILAGIVISFIAFIVSNKQNKNGSGNNSNRNSENSGS